MESKTLDRLWVKVTYEVELHNVEVPVDVYDELDEASERMKDIRMADDKYINALDWLQSNISESDCFSYEVEIQDMILEDE